MLLACAAIFLLPTASFAQTASDGESSKAVVLADVNLSNASIVSNNGKTLVVGLDIENRATQTQPDIRYGIRLVRTTDKRQEIADTFVASEIVSLAGNQSVHREIVYPVSPILSGDFDVWVIARTTGGMMLGLNEAGTVTLAASGDRVSIVPGTCHLEVSGDSRDYTLFQGVDVSPDETLFLVCTVRNESPSSLSIVPYFDTFRRNVYGDRVSVNYPAPETISLSSGETKEIPVVIPKASDPQAFDVSVFFRKTDGVPVSEQIVAHYVLRGASATIQNISLDKTSYAKGDMVNATIFASSSADDFPGSRAGQGTDVTLFVTFSMTDAGGAVCTEPETKMLEKGTTQLVFSSPAHIDCNAPLASVVVKDANGKVFDFRGPELGSQALRDAVATKEASFLSRTLAVAVVVILFLGSITLIVWKRFGKKGISGIFMLAFVLSGSMFFGKGAEAKTWAVYAEDIDTGDYFEAADFTVNTDKTTYAPGETIQLYGSAEYLHCSNGYGGYVLWASLTGNSDVGLGENDLGYSGWDDGEHDIYWLSDMVGGTLRAPSVPGEYNIRIHGYFEMDGDTGYDAVMIRITVAAPKADTLEVCEMISGVSYPRVDGAGVASLGSGKTVALAAFFDDTPGDCAGTDVTGSAAWTETSDPSEAFTVSKGSVSADVIPGEVRNGSMTIVYAGQSIGLYLPGYCNWSTSCTDRESDYCLGEEFEITDPVCSGTRTCTGTRSCNFNWREVMPGE